MSTVDAKLMCVVAALRHGIQTLNSPGLSINTHPNPFFLHVIGELDLKHIAERVIKNTEEFAKSEAKRVEADAATAASAVDGH
jgi:hypothetical protein